MRISSRIEIAYRQAKLLGVKVDDLYEDNED